MGMGGWRMGGWRVFTLAQFILTSRGLEKKTCDGSGFWSCSSGCGCHTHAPPVPPRGLPISRHQPGSLAWQTPLCVLITTGVRVRLPPAEQAGRPYTSGAVSDPHRHPNSRGLPPSGDGSWSPRPHAQRPGAAAHPQRLQRLADRSHAHVVHGGSRSRARQACQVFWRR
jgi:hypothetical protein